MNSTAVLVFIAQYVYILLMGLQSLNVNQRRYTAAAVCSFLLGTLGFFVTAIVGDARGLTFTTLWWGFVLAGPAGIVTAMKIHPWMVSTFSRKA